MQGWLDGMDVGCVENYVASESAARLDQPSQNFRVWYADELSLIFWGVSTILQLAVRESRGFKR